MSNASSVLVDAVWPEDRSRPWLRGMALALAGSIFIAICAHIQVPMVPVPMTMQTFAVLLIGLAFGWRLGTATVALYLAEGAIGLPVFAKGGGLAYFMGPTAGYLVGFLAAVFVVGWLAEAGWGRPAVRVFGAMLIGSALIYLFGAAWLATFLGFEKAIALGVAPFLIGDVVKACLAAACLPMGWHIINKFSLT